MKTIYIGLSTPSKFKIGAELIKLHFNTQYSHSYIRFKQESLQMSSVYQAAHGMVHFREFEKFKVDNTIIKEFQLTIEDELYRSILKECFYQAGEKYDYLDLLKIIYYELTKDPGSDDQGYICSELVGKICIEFLNMTFDKPKHLLTPKDIYNKLESTQNGKI